MKTNQKVLNAIKVIINAALVLQLVLLIAVSVSIFTVGSKYPDLSNRTEPCSQLVSLSANNISIVLNNEKLEDCEYSANIIISFMKYTRVSLLIKFLFSLLIIFQISLIFRTFPNNIFRSLKNSNRVRNISFLILAWVIIDFIVRFYPGTVIPTYLIYSSSGLLSLKSGFLHSLAGLNFNFLFIAVIMYFLSLVFEKGTVLQEESSLTI